MDAVPAGPGPVGAVRWIQYDVPANHRPPVAATLRLGELAHAAAMAQYGRLMAGASSPALSGRDGDGRPARWNDHAHWLPVDEDGDARIERIYLWVPRGLGPKETAACLLIDGLWEGGPTANGWGLEVPLRATDWGGPGRPVLPPGLVGPSRTWQSATPFVPPRHTRLAGTGAERRRVETAPEQLRREFDLRGIPAQVARLDPLDPAEVGRANLWRGASLVRASERHRLPAWATWWAVTFDRPVQGPLLFGHAAHFGLGRMAPAPSCPQAPDGDGV